MPPAPDSLRPLLASRRGAIQASILVGESPLATMWPGRPGATSG
jgi:hypothetical protein